MGVFENSGGGGEYFVIYFEYCVLFGELSFLFVVFLKIKYVFC